MVTVKVMDLIVRQLPFAFGSVSPALPYLSVLVWLHTFSRLYRQYFYLAIRYDTPVLLLPPFLLLPDPTQAGT